MSTITVSAAPSGNAARIADALAVAEVVGLDGDYITDAPIVVTDGRTIKGRANIIPNGNFDVFDMQGGSRVCGDIRVVTKETPSWNSAAAVFRGAWESGGIPTNLRPGDRTYCEMEVIGLEAGFGHGVALDFRTDPNATSNEWIMGVRAKVCGRGTDGIVRMNCGADLMRTFVTSNIVEFNWLYALQSVVMTSLHQFGWGIDGNTITGKAQSRENEQPLSPMITCGRHNKIHFLQWDWANPLVKRLTQHPNSLNEVIDYTLPLLTVNPDGDTLLRSSRHIVMNAAAGSGYYFRQAGSNIAYFDNSGRLTLLQDLVLAGPKRLCAASSAAQVNPAGPVKQMAVVIDGVEMLVEARTKL
jgi:hypothetical protein